ncbi:MAG: dienelactone hydrolase family protein [Chloroflexota bacterium]|nr:dienelactone hydrolase family protein [Chloroflexota bacterium]
MPENNHPQEAVIKDWTFRIKPPSQLMNTTRVILLLHGYMGNETAMWILTNPLPDSYLLIAPRAPIKVGKDQYSWHRITPQWPGLDKYQELADQLLARVEIWLEDNRINVHSYDLMGFSQGAVMAYALAFLYPQKIHKVAALASFIPQTWKPSINPDAIKNKDFFIAHGTQDEIIPIAKASKSAKWLEQHHANVKFCEADIGHKIGANCFKGLGKFFKE